MTSTLMQMAVLIACGSSWCLLKPGGLDAEQTRLVLTTVVYYLLLPAMVLKVLWQSEIGVQSLRFSQLGVASIVFGMALMWLIGTLFRFKSERLGALILATVPNVTYLGLPVLEQAFGEWARSVAIQIDLFAAAPLVFTLGIVVARHYGYKDSGDNKNLLLFLNAPPFWAAILAVGLNIGAIPMHGWLAAVLDRLADGVVPLMLFSLGLALNWRTVRFANIPFITLVIIIKLALMPLFAWWLNSMIQLPDVIGAAAILEMAMPCMVLGVVFCDRYGLDVSLYAMAVTVTTLVSMISLPLWFAILT
jgi:predicted permease